MLQAALCLLQSRYRLSNPFMFQVGGETLWLLLESVKDTVAMGFSREYAIAALNRRWSGFVLEDDDIIGHEDSKHWANDAIFGVESYWWMEGGSPKPLPVPEAKYWPKHNP